MSLDDTSKQDLLQALHKKLKDEFKDTILAQVQPFLTDQVDSDTQELEKQIYQSLVSSPDFYKFQLTFFNSLTKLNEDSIHIFSKFQQSVWDDGFRSRQRSLISLSNISTSSSFNQSGVLFLSNDQLHEANNMLLSSSSSAKLHALQLIGNISSLEFVVCGNLWTQLEIGLTGALLHPVVLIQQAALRVYRKMLSCSMAHIVKKGYVSLLTFLSYNITDGPFSESCDKSVGSRYQVLLLVNKFQQKVARHWLRYPQTVIEEIIESTFYMLSCSVKEKEPDSSKVWEYVVQVDPHFVWLGNWLHGAFSRSILFRSLKKHVEILIYILKSYTNSIDVHLPSKVSESCNISESTLRNNNITGLSHTFFLSRILLFTDGRQLFPVKIDESQDTCITLEDTLKSLIETTWKVLPYLGDNVSALVDCVVKTCSTILLSEVEVTQENILESLVFPVLEDHVGSSKCLQATRCLLKLTLNECFVKKLLGITGDQPLGLTIMKHTIFIFSWGENSNKELEEVRHNVIWISCNLLAQPKGKLLAMRCNLWKTLLNELSTTLARQRSSSVDNPTSAISNKILLVDKTLSILLNTFMGNQIGVLFLKNAGILLECVNIMLLSLPLEDTTTVCSAQCPHAVLSLTFALPHLANMIWDDMDMMLRFIWHLCEKHAATCLRAYQAQEQPPSLDLVFQKYIHLFSLYPAEMLLIHQEATLTKDDTTSIADSLNMFPEVVNENISSEDKHLLCLNVLSVMVTNIKTCLYLEDSFQLQKHLLLDQMKDLTEDKNIIIDEYSLIRNHIISRVKTIGGHTERHLAPRFYSENINKWPFITDDTVPSAYQSCKLEVECDIEVENWCSELDDLQKLQNAFIKYCCCESVKNLNNKCGSLIRAYIVLEEVTSSKPFVNFNDDSFESSSDDQLHCSVSQLGIEMCIKYAQVLNLPAFNGNLEEKKMFILRMIKNRAVRKREFDFFIPTVFIILDGQLKNVETVTHIVSHSWKCLYFWSSSSALHEFIYSTLLQELDFLVSATLPTIYNAFQMNGVLPSVIFHHWLGQCYWNYLDWSEICRWVNLLLLWGGDFVLYHAVAVLKHLEHHILEFAQKQQLLVFLKEQPIQGFQLMKYMYLIEDLNLQYHSQIETDLNFVCSLDKCGL
ncbi:protein broad-minded-like [Limulus polyphemus]|uniref:Protein broad-minded-like n=1 Tax=Limulus polyphemus TaxID=6850 RepID=A0ABM1TP72_LIMPO|nr:protein broad-minded-like [Limulus polyphemus]XP_022257678.1 protein broad-minded-like [Limulus polyphemus]XP_022257680.1 protein broad-minded-like [Limulus polyphemus]